MGFNVAVILKLLYGSCDIFKSNPDFDHRKCFPVKFSIGKP